MMRKTPRMQKQTWFSDLFAVRWFPVLLEVNASPKAYQNFTIS